MSHKMYRLEEEPAVFLFPDFNHLAVHCAEMSFYWYNKAVNIYNLTFMISNILTPIPTIKLFWFSSHFECGTVHLFRIVSWL